jgi:hypothetical protein
MPRNPLSGFSSTCSVRVAFLWLVLWPLHCFGHSKPGTKVKNGGGVNLRDPGFHDTKDKSDLLHGRFLVVVLATDTHATTLEVHNSTSWNRTEIACLSRESSAAGDHVTNSSGHPLPSQRLSSGELAILISDVPAFGAARYSLSHRTTHRHGDPVSFRNNALDNGILQVRIDSSTGDIFEFKLRGENQNLANIQGTRRVNQFLFMAGKNLDHLQSSGPARITVEDDGPLVAAICIESSAPTCKTPVGMSALRQAWTIWN